MARKLNLGTMPREQVRTSEYKGEGEKGKKANDGKGKGTAVLKDEKRV